MHRRTPGERLNLAPLAPFETVNQARAKPASAKLHRGGLRFYSLELFLMHANKPQDLHTLFVEAFNRGSVEDLLILYEENAGFVTGPGASITGKAAIREAMAGFLALKGTIRLETVSVAEGGGDLALLESRWSLQGTGPDGGAAHLTGSSREVVRRQPDGSWLYVIDNPGADSQ